MISQNRLFFTRGGFLILFVLFVNTSLFAQTKEERKEEKRIKKEQEVKQKQESTIRYMLLFEQQKFIFKAYGFDADGTGYQLDSDVNFIAVDSVYSRLQIVIDNHITENGINTNKLFGSVWNLIDGLIDNMTYKKAKNGLGFTAKAIFRKRRGASTGILIFNVSPEGDAKVSVTGLFREKLTFRGRIVPLKQNHIYDTLIASNFYHR